MTSLPDIARQQELQAKIGLPPSENSEPLLLGQMNSNSAEGLQLQVYVREWLTCYGLHRQQVARASTANVAKAYSRRNYRDGWLRRQNDTASTPKNAWGKPTGLDASLIDDAPQEHASSALPTSSNAPGVIFSEIRDLLLPEIGKTVDFIFQNKFASVKQELMSQAINTLRPDIMDLLKQTIPALVAKHLPPREVAVRDTQANKVVNLGLQHKNFDKLLKAVNARNSNGFRPNIWLTGPTGSGKTTAAENIAKALEHTFTQYKRDDNGKWTIYNPDGTDADLNGLSHDAPFGSDGSLDADYKVVGFKDANGKFHWTTFLRIYVFGGVYVADEIDNWMPSALLALNAALANGWISTPIGMLKRHPDACIIACANTWGLGATNEYVGRSKLDAASLDRFQPKLDWPVDEELELALVTKASPQFGKAWHSVIHQARGKAKEHGLKIIISPRATLNGVALLEQGFDYSEVLDMTICAGLSKAQIGQLALPSNLEPPATTSFDFAELAVS